MRSASRLALLLALAVAAAFGLAACGGGGGSTASTAAPTSTGSGTATAPAAKPHAAKATAPAAKPHSAKPAAGSSTPRPAGAAAKAGAAKPFVEPHADNSIPTFGSESTDSDRNRAAAALRAYLTARAKGDWAGACSGLATSVGKQLQALAGASKGKAKGCPAVYKALTGRVPASTRANPLTGGLLSLRVKGTQGFALWIGPHGQKYMMPMVREGSEWKATQLAPLTYPVGAPTPTSG